MREKHAKNHTIIECGKATFGKIFSEASKTKNNKTHKKAESIL